MGVKPTDAGNISESFVVRKHAGGERVNDDLCLTVLHFPNQRAKAWEEEGGKEERGEEKGEEDKGEGGIIKI